MLIQKKILIGIGGGIAAYKVCEVISTLFQQGAQVRVILTQGAQQFITPLTISTLSRHQAYTDQDFWQPVHTRPLHIELGEWGDLLVIAPLTANTLGKLSHGLADNLLTNTVLASLCPILLAPAMNTEMWEQQTVQQNWQQLQTNPRYHSIGPEAGLLACDRRGTGRMAEPEQIIPSIQSLLYTQGKRDLRGKSILISAGGTREHLDPVRFIGNPSSGKMGIAIAQAAYTRGATVTLVHAPISSELLSALPPVTRIPVVSAQEMHAYLLEAFPQHQWLIMSAAVGDVQPATYSHQKLSKKSLGDRLDLKPVPDILTDLASRKQPGQLLIGFAAQTGDIIQPALEKLQRKQLDVIVANPVDKVDAGFNSDRNQGIFLDSQGRKKTINLCTKLELAHQLLDFIS
ncbi:bifunctional phosphopantothenoylcysteine decarboxylase/phosphopantothenate--cysteine ligase CoaBC [Gloeocapsa sp. PCC 73106]|uniref:bifunctional phosphopantothenoylcysteine decarboxylase/phosphopantothenate--cysteine ligase CoaBC n=1 Tax=Gloeocapsa sp. PCC 73106 TaxID=102232 RepID=UPI0002ABAC67|nr:bifunctional phosphopantothenoylcysteine decarboxylase/phosphopantothenate--cysteine ligase CoaBC [Gloeocapsa sp. PCC 73106]ELR97073.1 phosphopantothenoylcysteine decarboxylase/phosphopantothenate--cysteine ligase [Gloeocapsa sp. PCC 73106]